MELYHVSSVTDDFRGCDKVTIHWLCWKREDGPPVPYEDVITNYAGMDETDRTYTEAAIDDLFTETEAWALAMHLLRGQGNVRVERETLPLTNPVLAFSATTVGGPTGFVSLPGNPLAVEVRGYYDVRAVAVSMGRDEWETMRSPSVVPPPPRAPEPLDDPFVAEDEAVTNNTVDVIIVGNGMGAKIFCPLCGTQFKPNVPACFEVRGGEHDRAAVCDECARTHNPELAALMSAPGATRAAVEAMGKGR